MERRDSGRIAVIVGLLIAVAAIVAVIALSRGDSRSGPTEEPTVVATTSTPTVTAAETTTDVPVETITQATTESLEPAATAPGLSSPDASQEFSLTPETGPAVDVPTPTDLPPDEVAPIDPDASARAAAATGRTVAPAGAVLALEDVPPGVGQWTSDVVDGQIAYVKAGGSLEDTITVTGLGPDSQGLDHWRSQMASPTDVGSGVCGSVGETEACVAPSDRFGEVLLFAAEGVSPADLREVAEGVFAELG